MWVLTIYKKIKFTFFFLFVAVFTGVVYFPKAQSVNVGKVLKTLPTEDREALEWLFLYLHGNTFPYVLFGDKPMSICLFLEIEPVNTPMNRVADFMDFSIGKLQLENLMGIKGWEAWKKYRSQFPSPNCILLENHDSGILTIVMINKRAFLKTVKENIDDFREKLGAEVTPEGILNDCIKAKDICRDILKQDHGLLGILLGYGKHNALLFSRRNHIEKFNNTALVPSEGFSSLDEEYRTINERLTYFDDLNIRDCNPMLMTLPMFTADVKHEETQQLKVKYAEQYKKIIQQYKKGDFLEVTLNQLCNR